MLECDSLLMPSDNEPDPASMVSMHSPCIMCEVTPGFRKLVGSEQPHLISNAALPRLGPELSLHILG